MSKKAQGMEELLSDLQNSLDAMSSSKMSVEDSIKEYAKAAVLIEKCYERLKEANIQVQEIDQHLATLEIEDEL